MSTPFIPALIVMSVISLLRLVSVVLMNHVNKEKPMNKVFRSTPMLASCICETLWAGIVSVVAGAISGHSEFISVLAKRFSIYQVNLLEHRHSSSGAAAVHRTRHAFRLHDVPVFAAAIDVEWIGIPHAKIKIGTWKVP